MSTRAQIEIVDGRDSLLFYRHSDGYPESVVPSLSEFMQWLADDKIRKNVEQAAGWLILLGSKEYEKTTSPNSADPSMGWKVGAYEPSTCIHGDIEFFYVIDLKEKTLKVQKVYGIDKQTFKTIKALKF